MNACMPDQYSSSVNPSAATKKAIRRSFRSRAANWNPFRPATKQPSTDNSSSQDSASIQGVPSNSVAIKKSASFHIADRKSNGNPRMTRAISFETLLTSMDCVDMSVAPTEPRSNLNPMEEGMSDSSFVSESVEDDDYDDDSVEEVVSLVLIEVDLQSRVLDQMSDVSDVSEDEHELEDEYAMVPWLLESPAVLADSVLLPIGEI